MANSKQAKKRARQNEVRRQANASKRSMMRTAIKGLLAAVAGGNVEQAQSLYHKATKIIDKMAGKGIIHRNTAARYKSRLNKRVKNLAQGQQ